MTLYDTKVTNSHNHSYGLSCFFLCPPDLGQATYFSAICMESVGLPRVQLQLNNETNSSLAEDAIQLIVNGTMFDVSLIEQDSNETQTLDGVSDSLLFKRTNVSVTVLTGAGLSVEAKAGNVCIALWKNRFTDRKYHLKLTMAHPKA